MLLLPCFSHVVRVVRRRTTGTKRRHRKHQPRGSNRPNELQAANPFSSQSTWARRQCMKKWEKACVCLMEVLFLPLPNRKARNPKKALKPKTIIILIWGLIRLQGTQQQKEVWYLILRTEPLCKVILFRTLICETAALIKINHYLAPCYWIWIRMEVEE